MPLDINALNNNSAHTSKTGEHKNVKIVHSDLTHSTNYSSSKTAPLSQDSVNLTETSKRIKALEEQIARLPIVDMQKVEQIKNSINDGKFEFNSERIAEKMIRFEKELG